jgi:hypothetical protein
MNGCGDGFHMTMEAAGDCGFEGMFSDGRICGLHYNALPNITPILDV